MYFCPSLLSPAGGSVDHRNDESLSVRLSIHHTPAASQTCWDRGQLATTGILFPPCHSGGPQNDDLSCVLPSICLSIHPSNSCCIKNLLRCETIFCPPDYRNDDSLYVLPSVTLLLHHKPARRDTGPPQVFLI
jgi:hypothetical protein